MYIKKVYVYFSVLSIILFGLFLHVNKAAAQTNDFFLHFSDEAIQHGYTAEYNRADINSWGEFRLAIMPGLVNEPINLNLKEFDGSYLPTPEGLKLVSEYYIYDILREDQANKAPLSLNKPLVMAIKFHSDNYFRKKVYYWAKPLNKWVPLPSSADYVHGYVRAGSHLPFSPVAVFEDPSELEGVASWYNSSKYAFGAATNNYAIGTKLRVRNVDNNKTVDVEVVSTGPFGAGRVIDLTNRAFQQIEDKWRGLARVQVWPLEESVKVLGVDTSTPSTTIAEPKISSAAVIALNEKTGEIIYSKNYDTKRPLASLTKLMTASIFLESGTSMDKIVAYDANDNAIGSALQVTQGETMTVKDLYFTMLVGSANNAANALARSTGLSREEFVGRMNAKAQELGLSNTHFVDPSGLDPNNVSTVYDIARMAKYAFSKFDILVATTSWRYSFTTISTGKLHVIDSTDKGMAGSSLYITGMKTGYLDEAGYCFALKARQGRDTQNHVITVVLGAANDKIRYDETNQLMNYALSKI